MLTPYDEYPVHQSSRPFSEVSSTDYAWDDGYFFGAFSADQRAFVYTGLRVSPNSDVIGGYAGICLDGRQRTLRCSRVWRPDFDVSVGPLRYELVTPLRRIHLRLGDNPAGLRFSIDWEAAAAPYEEAHHRAYRGSRRSTDQTRYVQCGVPHGFVELDGRRLEIDGSSWSASRDHSWGLYDGRRPLGDPKEWLPPPNSAGISRALRFWMPFRAGDEHTGFCHFHEGPRGERGGLDDVFGTPFEGWLDDGSERRLRFVDYQHQLQFLPGTRALQRGRLELVDEDGGQWRHDLELAAPPWFPFTIGYHQGSWRDGGTIATYHGPEPYLEWDDYDVSSQPFAFTLHGGATLPAAHGTEHVVRLRSTDPAGVERSGLAHLELFIDGCYEPYGFS